MEKEKQIELLQQEIDNILGYNTVKRIRDMFFDIVPNNTIIYSINEEYEKQKVAYAIDCLVCDYKANSLHIIKGVKFKVDDGNIFVIECINEDEDEIYECYWNLDILIENYRALSMVLNEYRSGHYSEEDNVTLISPIEAEDEYEDE